MPRTPKESPGREIEEEEREVADAPYVDESSHEEQEHARMSLWDDRRASFEDDDELEADIQDLDLDELSAMEGPDFY